MKLTKYTGGPDAYDQTNDGLYWPPKVFTKSDRRYWRKRTNKKLYGLRVKYEYRR